MAHYIQSRSSEQCRSHHQKYELKFRDFDKIISYIERKIQDLNQLSLGNEEDLEYEFMF